MEEDSPSSTIQNRTIFIGGIPLSATVGEVQTYLSSFDRVVRLHLPRDRTTKTLKGYARVVLASEAGVERILNRSSHRIGDLEVGVSRWLSQEEYLTRKDLLGNRKVFVKHPPSFGEAELRHYFSMFGPVVEVCVKTDPFTNRNRNFCYVIFVEEIAAREAVLSSPHSYLNKTLFCEMSKPPHLPKSNCSNPSSQGARLHKDQKNVWSTGGGVPGNGGRIKGYFVWELGKPCSKHYHRSRGLAIARNHQKSLNLRFSLRHKNAICQEQVEPAK